MYVLYKVLTRISTPLLSYILYKRCKSGKEIPSRVQEKKAIINKARPDGCLIWIHAASVGEAQSTLILINKILNNNLKLNILLTTGTVTSAKLMAEKLPARAMHQFYPLDNPQWVEKFINHWHPDAVIWMESELWPNMLNEIKHRNIPAVLVNAHMSKKSFSSWLRFPSLAKKNLSTFKNILCQNKIDKHKYDTLGAEKTTVTGNLKYSSKPLKYNNKNLSQISEKIKGRPLWLYASTHKGEEKIACEVHNKLKERHKNLLTIIVPRHPDRRDEIKNICENFSNLKTIFRGKDNTLPNIDDDIYIADTLGELGLFYSLSSIACIGRSLSDDGGGGHNPIEALQLNCAVLHGPNVQFQKDIFDEMNKENVAKCIKNPDDLCNTLDNLLNDCDKISDLQKLSNKYLKRKDHIIDHVMTEIITSLNLPCLSDEAKTNAH